MLIAVDVVNYFALVQWTPKLGLHHHDVLSHIAMRISAWMCRLKNQLVAILDYERLACCQGTTGLRTEARPIVPTSSDPYRYSATRAESIGLPLTIGGVQLAMIRAEMTLHIHLATAFIKWRAAGSAVHIGHQALSSPLLNGSQFSPRRFAMCSEVTHSVIADFSTEDAFQSKARGRKTYGVAACCTGSVHGVSISHGGAAPLTRA